MEILIVAATSDEIARNKFSDHTVLISGIGMVNTAINLTKELTKNRYDLVINLGIAGSFSDKLKIGDVVEVTQDCFSEIGAESSNQFLSPKQLNLNVKNTFFIDGKTNLKKARGITVNTVHGNISSIEKIKDRLNPDIESMEGAAVISVCQQFNTQVIQIRSISNMVEERNKENWNVKLAISNLNVQAKGLIDTL